MTTPVRLVTNDGSLIDLMCTTLTMNVDRNVLPLPIPLGGGSRFGFDLNLPKSTITLEGIISDDNTNYESAAISAKAIIDFTGKNAGGYVLSFNSEDNIEKIISGTTANDASSATHAIRLVNNFEDTGEYRVWLTKHPTNFSLSCDTDTTAGSGATFGSNPRIIRTASTTTLSKGLVVSGTGIPVGSKITQIDSATLFRIDNDVTATNTGTSLTFTGFYGVQYGASASVRNRPWVAVYNSTTSTVRTVNQIAADFAALINDNKSLFDITATVIDSVLTGASNNAVKLTQDTGGKNGNVNHPSYGNWPSNAFLPYTQQFHGGKDSTSSLGYSAGDRVAELYGVLNNSNNGGLGAALGGIPAVVSELFDADGEGGFSPLDAKYGDYIIGLQIPFKSNVNNNSSLFYMPTGPFKSRDEKRADQAKPAGTEFKTYGEFEYTGFKGAVANATFVQIGGEPLFQFTINFVPIDWII